MGWTVGGMREKQGGERKYEKSIKLTYNQTLIFEATKQVKEGLDCRSDSLRVRVLKSHQIAPPNVEKHTYRLHGNLSSRCCHIEFYCVTNCPQNKLQTGSRILTNFASSLSSSELGQSMVLTVWARLGINQDYFKSIGVP